MPAMAQTFVDKLESPPSATIQEAVKPESSAFECSTGSKTFYYKKRKEVAFSFKMQDGACVVEGVLYEEHNIGNTNLKPFKIDHRGEAQIFSSDSNASLGKAIFSKDLSSVRMTLDGFEYLFVNKK